MCEPAFDSRSIDRLTAGTLLAGLIAGLISVRAPELIPAHVAPAAAWSGPPSGALAVAPRTPQSNLALIATSGVPTPALRAEAGPRPATSPFGHAARIGKTVAVDDSAELSKAFERMGYHLDGLDDGGLAVPRVIVSALPPDLPRVGEADLRKTVFAKLLLPLVLQVNEALLEERHQLVALRDKLDSGGSLSARERRSLDSLAAYYNTDPDDVDGLIERVDIIPPSLALAQAALESGWGTSRVAREGNAVFGQYMFDAGLEPASGDPSALATYRLRTFGGLLDAVIAYAHNLNTHRAYRAFRAERSAARVDGRELDGYSLAGLLTRYSTRGQDYVSDVRRLIRQNDLDAFDNAWLVGSKITRVVFNDT